jgi:membrane-associated phospholipid phosphatase
MQEVDRVKEVPMQPTLQADWNPTLLLEQWLEWWKSRTLLQKLLPLILMAGFWWLHVALGGFRPDHLVVIFLVLAYYGGPRTQSLYRFFLPFTLYLALYDSQGYYADLIRGTVRVSEPYMFDLRFFGIETSEGRLLPSQWLQNHTHPVVDVISSFGYITFVPICLGLAIFFRYYLASRNTTHLDKETIITKAHAFMWGMFWLNILCCSTYYWFPAAPPWYVEQYGLGPAQLDALPSAAGAIRFDEIFNVNLFASYYSRVPNVFGAIPSGHVAFPLLALYFAFKLRSMQIFCLLYFLLVCFSAVYLNHHYVLDVLWGAAYGLFVAWAMDRYYRFKPAT